MATRRLPMNQTREILRLRWQQSEGVRSTAAAVGVGRNVVSKTCARATGAGLTWYAVTQLDDEALEKRLYGERTRSTDEPVRPEPDPEWIHREYRRAGVTLELLHLEYQQAHPDGYGYTSFCERYRAWLKRRGLSMRQTHHAGEKAFLDYSGKKPSYWDRASGTRIEVELFVAVLGASNLTFVEASPSQQLEHWVGSNVRALNYFGGVPSALIPDQLKSAVAQSDAFDPGIQKTYAEFATHYQTVIFPARPRKPRDKAKVEVAVQVAQRWILARLRNETFFSLGELNRRIAELVEELNARPMKKLGGVSRRELYERIERGALRPLPAAAFEPAVWEKAKANADYHVEFEKHWYSVTHTLSHEEIWVRASEKVVELFHLGRRVAAHTRSKEPYKHTTDPAHRHADHRAWAEADPGKLVAWAESVGPSTALLMQRILGRSPFPEQAWRSGRGLKRVGMKYPQRIEVAAERALRFGATSYKPVDRMLRLGLDQRPLPGEDGSPDAKTPQHANVRGPGYYH
jgi:transposase